MRYLPVVSLFLLARSPVFPAVLTGTVVDDQGRAVAGATVCLARDTYGPGREDLALLGKTTTTADGSFTLEDADRDLPDPGESWHVYAHKDGLALAYAKTRNPTAPLELKLRPAGTLAGQLLKEGGQPLAGASVAAFAGFRGEHGEPAYESVALPEEVRRTHAVQTDETGAFELRLFPPGWQAGCLVEAEAYGMLYLACGPDARTVQLQPAGTLRGQVVGPDGPLAVAGIRIMAYARDEDRDVTGAGETTTGQQGEFTLQALQPGNYVVEIGVQLAAAYHIRDAQQAVTVESGQETTLELMAERTATLRGRVVDAATGTGIEGALLWVRGGSYGTWGTAGPDGRFETPCLPGEFSVAVSARGYVPLQSQHSIRVTVAPGGSEMPDIELTPGRTVEFVVKDRDDQPVPGAKLLIDDQTVSVEDIEGVTGPDGSFVAAGLAPGPATVWAEKDELCLEHHTPITIGATREPVALTIRPGFFAGVTAVAVDENNRPIRGAEVHLTERRERSSRPVPCPRSDERGRITCSRLRPGLTHTLRIEVPDAEPYASDGWTAEAGIVHDLGTISFARATGWVAGVVVEGDGTPVPGARVFNARESPSGASAVTDVEGRFRLEGLVPGHAMVFVDSPAHRFTGVRAATGADDLRIVLAARRPATLRDRPAWEPQIPRDEARQIAKSLILEALRQSVGHDPRMLEELLERLAAIDVEAALLAAAEGSLPVNVVYIAAGRARLAEDFEAGLELINRATDHWARVEALCESARAFLPRDRDLAIRCLEEAASLWPAIPEPARMAEAAGRIGGMLVEFDREAGLALLQEARELCAPLGRGFPDTWARRAVSEGIAPFDLDAALALVAPIEDRLHRDAAYQTLMARYASVDPDRALELADLIIRNYEKVGGICDVAAHVAATDPDRALAIIESHLQDNERDRALVTVLPLFPTDELDRAVELARKIPDSAYSHRARALGRLSQVVPRERAPELIEEALQACTPHTAPGYPTYSAANDLACLALVARNLGYSEYEEIAFRAASLIQPDPDPRWSPEDWYEIPADYEVARIIAFTAPDLARHVLESRLARDGGLAQLHPRAYSTLVGAAVEADARWGLSIVEQLPPDPPDARYPYRAFAIETAVRVLLDEPAERQAEVVKREGHGAWLVDGDQRR